MQQPTLAQKHLDLTSHTRHHLLSDLVQSDHTHCNRLCCSYTSDQSQPKLRQPDVVHIEFWSFNAQFSQKQKADRRHSTKPYSHPTHHCVFLITVTWLPVCVLMK